MFKPQLIYNNVDDKRKNSFIHYFANRVLNNNKNFLCAVTGPTGSGKSWLCGAISEIYSKLYNIGYNPKIHILFSIKELLDLINRKDLKDVLPPGSIIMFDEPQVSVNAREWRSEANQILSTLTSTFRNMRLIVFFATPYLEFIDKQSRILFHAEIQVLGFDKTRNITTCKPRFLEWSGRKGDFYKKRLIIKYPSEDKTALNWYYLQLWEVSKPSKEWIDIYEAQKIAFTRKLNKELQQQYEYTQAQVNKGRDLVKLMELWDKHGYKLNIFADELPHLSPYALERLIAMVRKQKQIEEKKRKEELKLKKELEKAKKKENAQNSLEKPENAQNSENEAL